MYLFLKSCRIRLYLECLSSRSCKVQTMVLNDRTHMAKVKSKDSYRHFQFVILKLGHYRDHHELRNVEEA